MKLSKRNNNNDLYKERRNKVNRNAPQTNVYTYIGDYKHNKPQV